MNFNKVLANVSVKALELKSAGHALVAVNL